MISTAQDTMQLFVPLLDLGPGKGNEGSAVSDFIETLTVLTKGLPPISLVATGANDEIISHGL